MDSLYRPTFGERVLPHYWPVSGVNAIVFCFSVECQNLAPVPLATIDKIVDPGGL